MSDEQAEQKQETEKPETAKAEATPSGEATTAAAGQKAVAVAEKPPTGQPGAGTSEEKPVTTDVFNNCTSRCSRRAWNIFLEYAKDIEIFKTRRVRGRLVFKTPKAAQQAHGLLVEQGGVTHEITTQDNWIEFTGTLAAVQLVIKAPDTEFFDAVKIE